MKARIYRPAHTTMQSGKATHRREWTLEFLQQAPLYVEPLMGWTGMTDMTQEVRLTFDSEDAAIAYAKANRLDFVLVEPKLRKIKPKSYAANFAYNRVKPWHVE